LWGNKLNLPFRQATGTVFKCSITVFWKYLPVVVKKKKKTLTRDLLSRGDCPHLDVTSITVGDYGQDCSKNTFFMTL